MNIKTSQLKEIIKNALLETINSDESVDEGFLDKVRQSLSQHVVEPFRKEFKQVFHSQAQQTPKTQTSVPPVIGSQPPQAQQVQAIAPTPVATQMPLPQASSTQKPKPVFSASPRRRIKTADPKLKMMPPGVVKKYRIKKQKPQQQVQQPLRMAQQQQQVQTQQQIKMAQPQQPVIRGKQHPKLVRGKQGTYRLEETITEEQLKNLIKEVIKVLKK